MEKFLSEYEAQLRKAITDHPNRYGYGLDKVPDFMEKMRIALPQGNIMMTDTMKATCRALGIASTIKAVKEYIK
jgi:hypothetical protein